MKASVPLWHVWSSEAFSTYKQTTVLVTPVVSTKFAQLAVHVEVQEGAVRRRADGVVQDALGARDGAVLAVIVAALDIRGVRDVEYVDVSVYGQGLVLAVAEAAVSRQDEELAVGKRVYLGLGCYLGVL